MEDLSLTTTGTMDIQPLDSTDYAGQLSISNLDSIGDVLIMSGTDTVTSVSCSGEDLLLDLIEEQFGAGIRAVMEMEPDCRDKVRAIIQRTGLFVP